MLFSSAVTVASCAAPFLISRASAAILTRDVASFIATERPIALQGVLNNIGPNGKLVSGAASGLVIASPSLTNPNYFYTWTRDSALTLKMLVDELLLGNSGLQSTIEDYIKAQAILQTVTNPSGTFLPNGAGLGEPKYLADGKRFNGAWGRPQRDGPALRAIALITYSNWLASQGQTAKAKTVLWPVISNDLSYVGQYWNQTGFDLWEEVSGSSFFTVQNQHRALVEGAQLAKRLGVTCTGCDQAPQVLCFLQTFWNGRFIVSNINANTDRSGLDANSILGPISVFDIDAYCDSPTFQPCNSKSLANFKALIDSFRKAYTLNSGIAANQGVAVGRYTEDVYFGGNPWYLSTLAAAEFLYDAVAQWKARHVLYVDSTSLAFFQDLYPAVTVRQYNSGNDNSPFAQIVNAVTAYADSFVAVAQKYTPADGSLAEQFDRNNGTALSAVHLTWSYASFISMAERRAGQYPPSWNTRGVAAPPSSCAATSTKGVYAPATAAGAPFVNNTCTVTVHFSVNASTYYGENVYVTGSSVDLGSFDGDNAHPLTANQYTAARPWWQGDVELTAGQTLQYQYVRAESCNRPYIYESVKRNLTVPACGQPGISTDDAWTGEVGTFC